MAPGFKRHPGKFELAVTMTRIMFPFLLLVALVGAGHGHSERVQSVWRARDGFDLLQHRIRNVAGLLLGKGTRASLGISPIHGMAYGVVIGGAMQLLWQVPSLQSRGFPLPATVRLVASGTATNLSSDGTGYSRAMPRCRST